MTQRNNCIVKNGTYYCKDTGEKCPLGLFDKTFGKQTSMSVAEYLIKNSKDIDPAFVDIVDKHFEDLLLKEE